MTAAPSGCPLLLPPLHHVSHLEWLQKEGADLLNWGPRNRGMPWLQALAGPGLFTWLPRRLGEGPSRGRENLAFKGAPPGSGLGLGRAWGGSTGTVASPPDPCGSPGPAQGPWRPHPGPQRPPARPYNLPRLISPHAPPSRSAQVSLVSMVPRPICAHGAAETVIQLKLAACPNLGHPTGIPRVEGAGRQPHPQSLHSPQGLGQTQPLASRNRCGFGLPQSRPKHQQGSEDVRQWEEGSPGRARGSTGTLVGSWDGLSHPARPRAPGQALVPDSHERSWAGVSPQRCVCSGLQGQRHPQAKTWTHCEPGSLDPQP